MAMKRKYQIEEEIADLQDSFDYLSEFISNGLLQGRTDLGIAIERRSNIQAKIEALRWVIDKTNQ